MREVIVRVFVSSTWLDLQPERTSIERALERLRETKFIGMEYFGSRHENPSQGSLEEIDRCEAYVGVFGGRYGSGITEAEYRRARHGGLPCFIYFKAESSITPEERETDPNNLLRLAQLKEELRKAHTVSTFSNPDDLAARLTADLHRWLFESFLTSRFETLALQGGESEIQELARAVRDTDSLRAAFARRGVALTGDLFGGLLTVGNGIAKDLLLQGINALPTDYGTRFENFLTEYLGTAGRPVPFGGRDAVLVSLNEWIDDSRASPYLLIATPAGRGKSALLVRWSRSLLVRKDLAVVFFPVSIRFRTNLATVVFASLTARLAALHGEQLPALSETSVETWRGMMADYLKRSLADRRRLVLILDGVDEAADWQVGADLFPLSPPEGLRVIVSSRYLTNDQDAGPWLRRLGWARADLARAMDLQPLTLQGVADVVSRTGLLLNLSEKALVIRELYRLSEGDPLLVGLYVDEISIRASTGRMLRPMDLLSIRPGLDGFFDQWWDDQHKLWPEKMPLQEQAVRSLLNLFSCALGPLSRGDVLRLVPSKVGLDSWGLQEALRILHRFVVGDGRERGYVFSHPKLALYFYEQLAESERQQWNERFLTWGREILTGLSAGTLTPGETSPYMVQYCGTHLERAGASADALLSLVSDGWARSWEALEGGHAGFMNDVERAWSAAEASNRRALQAGLTPSRLADEFKCALVRASITSLVSNVPPHLLAMLVETGVWSARQGIAYSRAMPDDEKRGKALAALAPHLPEGFFPDALEATTAIGDDRVRAQALVAIGARLPEPLLGILLSLLTEIGDHRLRADVLVGLNQRLGSLAGGEALNIASGIEDSSSQAMALAALAPHLPSSALLDQGLALAAKIRDEQSRAAALAAFAARIHNSQWEAFLDAASTINDEAVRTKVLVAASQFLPETALHRVVAIGRACADELHRARMLSAIAVRLQQGTKEEVVADPLAAIGTGINKASATPSKERRGRGWLDKQALTSEMLHLSHGVNIGTYEEVFEERWWSEFEATVSETMLVLAPQLSDALVEEGLKVARSMKYSGFRAQILFALAPKVAAADGTGMIKEACDLMMSALHDIHEKRLDPYVKPTGWIEAWLERLLQDMSNFPEAVRRQTLAVACSVQDAYLPEGPKGILRSFARRLPETLAGDALEIAATLQSEENKSILLTSLSPRLSDKHALQALTIARKMSGKHNQVKVLAALIPRLSTQLRSVVFEELIAALRVLDLSKVWTEMFALDISAFPDDMRDQVVGELLTAIRNVQSETDRANTLTVVSKAFAPIAEQQLVQVMVDIARSITRRGLRGQVLLELGQHTRGSLRQEVLREALALTRVIGDQAALSQALAILAQRVTGPFSTELFGEAVRAAESTLAEREQSETLLFLIPRLPVAMQAKVAKGMMAEAAQITDHVSRAEVFSKLACFTSGALRSRALNNSLQAAMSISDPRQQGDLLSFIVPLLSPRRQREVVPKVLGAALRITDEQMRWDLVATVEKYIPDLLLADWVAMIDLIKDEGVRRNVEWRLARHLPESKVYHLIDREAQEKRPGGESGFGDHQSRWGCG